MIEATVEATENLLPQDALTEEVEAKTSDLPEDVKPEDDAKPESDAKPEDKPEPSEADKIKYAMQKRIDKQTAKLAEMERLLAEKEAALLKTQPQPQTDAPREEDYTPEKGGYEQYLKDLGKWEAKQEADEAKRQQAQAERDAAYQKTMAERKAMFEEKEAEFKKLTPDYDEKVAEVETSINLLTDKQKSTIEFQVFRDMLFSSDNMPALTYELGKNPDLLDKMLTMNPLQIARQIARLEIQLESAPKQQHKPVTAPPTPISSGSKVNKSIEEMSYKELKKKMGL